MIPIVSAALIAMLQNKRSVCRYIYFVNVVFVVLSSIVATWYAINNGSFLYKTGNFFSLIGISFLLNIQSAVMLIVISSGFLFSSICFLNSVRLPTTAMSFALILISGFCGIVLTADMFNTYVFIELSSIASYALISFSTNGNRTSYKVAFDYLIIGSFAGIFILLGILMLYLATGTLSMHGIFFFSASNFNSESISNTKLLQFGYVITLCGVILKAGLYPLHTWLIKTYTVSSPPVSSLLGSTATKVYVFLMYKIGMMFFYNTPIRETMESVSHMLIIMAIIGMIFMGLSNIGEKNLKKEIAVSSMIQICYFVIGVFSDSPIFMTATMLQMLVHSISIATMFAILDEDLYNIDKKYQPKTTREIPKYLLTRSKVTKFAFPFLILSIAGYPITSGFLAKWMFSEGALQKESIIKFAFLIVSNGIGMIYSWRIIERIIMFEAHHHYVSTTKTTQSTYLKILSLFAVFLLISIGVLVFSETFFQLYKNTSKYFS